MDTAAPGKIEKPEVWMVYLPEWLIFYTSANTGEAGWHECLLRFEGEHQGKIRSTDWRIVTPDGKHRNTAGNYTGRWRLQLCVPNLRGIFRDKDEADSLSGDLGQDAVVVARFSAEEKHLLRYGKSLIREQ